MNIPIIFDSFSVNTRVSIYRIGGTYPKPAIWASPVSTTARPLAFASLTTGKNATKVEKSAYESAAYLERSFRATNAQGNGFLVHNYSQINRRFLSKQEITHIAYELHQHFNFTDVREIEESNIGSHQYALKGRCSNATSLSITLTSFRGTHCGSNRTVLVIRVRNSEDNLDNLNATLTSVTQAVIGIGAVPHVSSSVSGQIPGKLVGVNMKRLVSAALWAVHAKAVEGIDSPLMASVSAYSLKGPMYILTNNRQMNLQVAVHYDEYHIRQM